MKKLISGLCLFGLCTLAAYATPAEEAYQKGDFSKALTEYQQEIKTATGDKLYKAQLRVIGSQYMLGEYMNAAKTAFSTPLPKDPLWKARFLLYRIHAAQSVTNMYWPALSSADEEKGEFEQLSQAQWKDKINESFETLWTLRSYLIYVPITNETLIIDTKDTDTRAIPTLFDFVVSEWKNYLTLPSEKPLRAAEVITADYKATDTKNLDLEKLLYVLTQAANLGGTNRANARLIWEADRILLPFQHQAGFTFSNVAKQRTDAIALLQMLADYAGVKQKAWFNRLFRSDKADYGRAYAAYQAARMLDQDKEYEQAVKVCEWATTNLENSYYTNLCKNLAADIRKPVLNVKSAPYTQDPAQTQLTVSVRNIPNVYVRIYKLSEADLLHLSREKKPTSWNYLTHVQNDDISALLDKTPISKLVKPVSYKKPYDFSTEQINLPPLQPSFYAVAFSYNSTFNPQKEPVSVIVLNATELALFVTSGIEDDPAKYHTPQNTTLTPNIFRIYTVNLKTGQPVSQADITYFTDWRGNKSTGKSDINGILTVPFKVQSNRQTTAQILPKASKDNSTALLNSFTHFNFSPSPFKLYMETDRAVYRPGQTVQLAVYGFEADGRGWKTLSAGSQVKLEVRDANYDTVLSKTLSLNPYGTAQAELTLPETGLLGQYRVELSYTVNKQTYRANTSFQVEEYKRPEYEVSLDPAGALLYDKEVTVSGKAVYYFGAPLENAKVTYTVTRTSYHPPFCWWWNHTGESEQIAQGTTHTQKDGTFAIQFTPQPGKQKNRPYRFEVAVSVQDASGRNIDAQQTYKVSHVPAFFSVSFEQGFYDENTASTLAQVKLLDINGQSIPGTFTAEILELENTLPSPAVEQQNTNPDTTYTSATDSADNNTLEGKYANNAVLRSISKQTFSYKDGSGTTVQLPSLPEGIYRLKLSAKNAEQTELIFLVTAPESRLKLPEVSIAQYPKYYPGDQAKILIGSAELAGPKRVEVYQDKQFLAVNDRVGRGVNVYTLPIQNEWRGGVNILWFGASNWKTYQGHLFIDVPHDNKALDLSVAVPQEVKPGQKVNWKLTAKNAAGAFVNGQATVRVYDKSLDYYADTKQAFGLNDLYPSNNSYRASLSDSAFSVYQQTYVETGSNRTYLNAPQLPQLNLSMRLFSRYGLRGGLKLMAAKAVNTRASGMTDDAMVSFSADEIAEETAVGESARNTAAAAEKTVSPRTDFSETAYYNPMLPLIGGKATASFTMPQSLTAWKVQALAFTKDASVGSFTAQTVTRKDIMVRLSLPRFWREGDQSTLVAQVTNVTDKKITARIILNVTVDGKNAAAAFGLDKLTQTITVPAKSNTAVKWPVTVPDGVGIATITATVRSGEDSDSEQRQLPLLPAKERLAESTTVALETGSQTLRLENLLQADNTRRVSAVTLRVDPGLLLTVLNSMPQLLRPGYNDALSVADRYVPLAVLNGFYKTYPLLQNAVGKLPQRHTQLPVWDNTDPARLLLVEETPWLQTARGGAERKEFLTDIFNPTAVNVTREKFEKQLAKYQTASGGFSWMPSGEPSEFITLRLLASYAQILRYGGEIPQASAQKALAWLAPRIEKNLQKSEPSVSAVSYALYGAYVFTAYPQNWKAVKSAPVKKWLDYADKHSTFMTALGQTYAATAYYRLGENTKAQNYLDLVLSRMKIDPVSGAYFAPEAQSWLWYNDTLATQTATLRTLLEIRPESEQAAELVKWLLLNRKAQQWRDSTAAAQAVYTLLEYMQRKGLLNDPAQYLLQWGPEHKTLNFEPLDWSGQLAWTQQAENVNPQYYTAQVTKRGGLTGFVTLDAVYTTSNAQASQPGVLNVSRRYLLKYSEDGREKVRALSSGEKIPSGSEVEVELTLTASSAFDFVLLADPKPAGFENTELTSGWTWDALSYYREIRDTTTHFFFNRVPAGTYTLRYTLRPTLEGTYHALPAQVQSMYAPEFSAHSAAEKIEVKK